MSKPNRLSRVVGALRPLPLPLRRRALSLLMGRMVPFVGTARLEVAEMEPERVVIRVYNRRSNRNHIGQVHAAAMALAAETATGFVMGVNVPDSRLLLLKSMKVDFKKRSRGDMEAVATLTEEQLALIRSEQRADVDVEVHVTDEQGIEPIECQMVWAFLPRKRS